MKIVILAPNPPDCVSFGPRQLASLLKTKDHECSVVFLRGSIKRNRHDQTFVYSYPPAMLQDIVEICKDADVIGVSFMSLYYDRGVQLTETMREAYPDKPIIWGGTHASLRPTESMEFADYICVGEGEHSFLEWLDRFENGGDLTNVQGFWCKVDGELVDNGEAPLVDDLNTLPWPDMDTEGHFVDNDGRIVPMSSEMMRKVLPRLPYFNGTQHIGIRLMATRGCPHRCTYCASSAQTPMRRRSVESTISHIEWLMNRYDFLETIYEFDDTFFATPQKWLREFAEQYKARIGKPWHCQTSPSTLNRKKLDLLVDAGLVYCEMGIQSGSEEIKKLFKRTETDKQVLRAGELLHEYYLAGKLQSPRYHIITDNPWESPESVLMTIKMLLKMPRPFELAIGSLCLFPGTELNNMARAEGLLTDEINQVYRKPFLKPKPNMLNWLIYASGINWIPQNLLLRLAEQPKLLELVSADTGTVTTPVTKGLHQATNLLDRFPRAFDALRTRDFERIKNSFEVVL